ncbi:MAG: PIN domain-containing protein [Caldilineaceae bacterium]|nr:PIN domain-containing protein [Caldilineaceae bacterium]
MEPKPFQPAVVFLDANVLYPAGLRDFLMRLTLQGLYHARWSAPVHEEWMQAVLRDFPDLTYQQLERTRDLMNRYAVGSLVTGFEHRIEQLSLPDPDDRHVLAAAIHGKAAVILTRNLKDFPALALTPHGIRAEAPDPFIHALLTAQPEGVSATARQHRANLRNPPKSVEEYLASLEQQGLHRTVAALRAYGGRI